MYATYIIVSLALSFVGTTTAADDGDKLFNFIKDYPTKVDPTTIKRLMAENGIQSEIVPFHVDSAPGFLKLINFVYVPTQGFTASKVSLYNVQDDGQTYDFRFTYSIHGANVLPEKAQLLLDNQLTDVQFKAVFDYTEIHMSFKKTQVDGQVQVNFDALDVDYISFHTKVSGPEATLAKVVSHAANDHLKRMYEHRAAFSFTSLAVNDLAPKLQELLSK
ncbi:hypothetical protein HDE_07640 [Halotydeus destructor]|nr:hypothetical protein HDE_07640 [Halotydeus destructor]